MRLRTLGTLTAVGCVAMLTALSAQDTARDSTAAQNPKPTYTTQEMLRRIRGQNPDVLQNAALIYWMAFAQMKELPVGSSAPDTDTLLDANADALATMARGARLTNCDWGLEYALGAKAPIAHLAKARALGRVNSASAVRAIARGRADDAVEQWLVGMHFAGHIESGGTLISTLSAWSVLRELWSGIEPWATEKRYTAAQRARLLATVQMLPDTVFQWSNAVLNEARILQTEAGRIQPAGSSKPTEAETKRFLREIERAAVALTLPPDQAAPIVTAFDNEVRKELHPFYRDSTPSLTRVNETRREVKAARERLLALLK